MSKEILAIKDEDIPEVVKVIRAGLRFLGDKVTQETQLALNRWCNREMQHIKENEEKNELGKRNRNRKD